MTFLAQWRDALNAIYPGLWNAALGLAVVLALWATKKLKPDLFARLPPAVQALPAMILSAVATALSATSPTLGGFLSQLLAGSLVGGTMAVGVHRVLKESPLPYGGTGGAKADSLKPPKPPIEPPTPPTGTLALAGLLLVFFDSFGSVLLAVACGAIVTSPIFFAQACTPAEAGAVVKDVETVAQDVTKIAQVLCLSDQARVRHASVRQLSVQDVCKTVEQLAPYMPAAETPTVLASRGACP